MKHHPLRPRGQRPYEKLPTTERVPIPGHPDARMKHELLLKHEKRGADEHRRGGR